MPTPHFNFRLARDKAAALHQMAKIYGAPSTSEFLREMVGAMCSGQPDQVRAFVGKLIAKAGEQLTLQLTAPMDAAVAALKPKKKGIRKRKGGKVRARP